ncbi:MAG: HD domain-containing protein [Acidobacteria bacterium]|nr:HD domain-containing protein [Acidobacteriota bacterium]
MTDTRKPGLTFAGRAYIHAVGAVGLTLSAWCVWSRLDNTPAPSWLIFAVLTTASGTISLKIPSIQSRLTVSEIFAFTSILLFGPMTGALSLAGLGLVIGLRWRFGLARTVFNVGNLALSGWVSGVVFFSIARVAPLYGSSGHYGALMAPLLAMTAAYYVVNCGLVCGALAIEARQPVLSVWREHFLSIAPSYLAYASVSLLLVVAMREVHLAALALIVPLLLISYLTLYSSFGRLEDSKLHVTKLNHLLLSTVETLATAIDAKDEVTHDHVRRVQQGTLALARLLGVSDTEMLKAIEAAALLHDTGKIAVPEHILNKPGKLTPAEYDKMKRHAPIGAEILSSIAFPYPVVPIVRHHHENWDGTGYPDGLRGAEIPLGARILSVVDCFDALTSDRPYRRRMTDEQALAILRDRRGTMYDPLVVDTFIANYKAIMPEANSAPHPAARAIGDARAQDRGEREPARETPTSSPAAVNDSLLAVSSLARAMSGDATITDVGALMWMIVRQVLPAKAMAVFLVDEQHDEVAVRFAAGVHAHVLRSVTRPTGTGIAGWVAVNVRPAVNADAGLDLGMRALELSPPLRSCLAVPLMDSDALVAVLALYSDTPGAFSDDDLRLMELLAPRLASSLVLPALDAEEEGFVAAAAAAAGVAPPGPASTGGLKLVKRGERRRS